MHWPIAVGLVLEIFLFNADILVFSQKSYSRPNGFSIQFSMATDFGLEFGMKLYTLVSLVVYMSSSPHTPSKIYLAVPSEEADSISLSL